MTDWKKDLEEFFKAQGYKDLSQDCNPVELEGIINFIKTKTHPALIKLAYEFNNYANFEANLTTIYEDGFTNFELKILWVMQPKFQYKLKFGKSQNVLVAMGQYCIPDMYGNPTDYTSTDMKNSFSHLEEKDIISDFINVFKTKTDLT